MNITTQSNAKANKQPHYFTGKPCKRGHIAKRFTHNGTCMECHALSSRAYNKTASGRVAMHKARRAYRSTESGKQATKRYLKSDKGVTATARFRSTNKYQQWVETYRQTEEYKAYRKMLQDIRTLTGKSAAANAKRRAQIKQALVGWADIEKIRRIYIECAEITRSSGVIHNVDHIIPLNGKNVCGLHVEYNLRVIPAIDNFRRPKVYIP